MRALIRQLSEAVDVDKSLWTASTGLKTPSADGLWMFVRNPKKKDYDDKQNYFSFNGRYADAKKAAIAWAKSIGASFIYLAP